MLDFFYELSVELILLLISGVPGRLTFFYYLIL